MSERAVAYRLTYELWTLEAATFEEARLAAPDDSREQGLISDELGVRFL